MTTAATAQIVTFRLGGELFAADIYSVERVLRYQTPTAIPNVPAWLEGVIDYQGRVVPVINLRRRFEMPVVETATDTRILVFTAGGEWIAATVDAVLEVSPLDPATASPPPAFFKGLAGEYLQGIVRRTDRLVIMLDIERLLSATERLVLDLATEDGAEAVTAAGPPEGVEEGDGG